MTVTGPIEFLSQAAVRHPDRFYSESGIRLAGVPLHLGWCARDLSAAVARGEIEERTFDGVPAYRYRGRPA